MGMVHHGQRFRAISRRCQAQTRPRRPETARAESAPSVSLRATGTWNLPENAGLGNSAFSDQLSGGHDPTSFSTNNYFRIPRFGFEKYY
jgi:hypothetical protein